MAAPATTPTSPRAGSAAHFITSSRPAGPLLRRNLARGDPVDFPRIEEARSRGETDYVALVHRFAADGVIGEMDCVYSAWASDAPDGFPDPHVEALTRLAPALALAAKCASLARIAGTLVETYLGRDAGRRVLEGRILRGVADRIAAVLWFSDLRGFTRITDTAAPEQVIPLLNDYAEAVISAVYDEGGDVLKLIGDGTLAIFTAEEPAHACRCALAAEALMREPRPRAQRAPERAPGCRPPTSTSASTSATCSTAISAAPSGSTSRWSARR